MAASVPQLVVPWDQVAIPHGSEDLSILSRQNAALLHKQPIFEAAHAYIVDSIVSGMR